MTREEILEKGKKENQGKDFADLQAQSKGSFFAYWIALVACCAMTLLEKIFTNKFNPAYVTICFAMFFTAFLVKAITLKKKHEIFVTVCYGVMFICLLGLSIAFFMNKAGA